MSLHLVSLILLERYRLYASNMRPIIHYTLLLLIFVIAAYKDISLRLLSATMVGEVSSIPFLVGKLQQMAGKNLRAHSQ
jgi:hypothetical protein